MSSKEIEFTLPRLVRGRKLLEAPKECGLYTIYPVTFQLNSRFVNMEKISFQRRIQSPNGFTTVSSFMNAIYSATLNPKNVESLYEILDENISIVMVRLKIEPPGRERIKQYTLRRSDKDYNKVIKYLKHGRIIKMIDSEKFRSKRNEI